MGEVVSFPVPSLGGAVRRALDGVPTGPDRASAGVARGARELARYTTVHHRLDAFTRQCDTVLKAKAGPGAGPNAAPAVAPGAEVIPFSARCSGVRPAGRPRLA